MQIPALCYSMLMDELRTEPKTLNQKDFKKFIKSCNLYKDKVMTQSFFDNFATKKGEVDCEAILAAYDKEFPKTEDKIEKTIDEAELIRIKSEGRLLRDTSMVAMLKW